MNSQVCVDASFILKLALPEEDSPKAVALWRQWRHQERKDIVAPLLLRYEISSVLRNRVYRNIVSMEEGHRAINRLLALPIIFHTEPTLPYLAWELASQLNRPNSYDSNYLVVAQFHDCEFWTADRRLYNAVSERFSWVRLLQEAEK